MTEMFTHAPWCQHKSSTHEAAQRIADTYNLHLLADQYGNIGKWFASSIEDGRGDNVLYDTRLECVLHQKHNESRYTYVKIHPGSTTDIVCEMAVMLNIARRCYEKGIRMADPERRNGGQDFIKRTLREDQLNLLRGVVSNIQMPYPR